MTVATPIPTPIPMLDLTRRDAEEMAELTAAFQRVLAGGRFILGPEVEEFEGQCADYLGVEHAIGVSSGTDALLVALMALGIGPGDEVLCPAYSFVATAEVIVRLGAIPVFVDIDPRTYNLSVGEARRRLTAKTRAMIAVHLFGLPADMDGLLALSDERQVPIVEDAAQAFGSGLAPKRSGTLGALGCYSFFPSKNLGGFGDGGLVVTRDPARAEAVRQRRQHGQRVKHHYDVVGGNFRLDALQAALLRVRLRRLDGEIARRRHIARRYDEVLRAAGSPYLPPVDRPEGTYNQYVIRTEPDLVESTRRHLAERGISTDIYYPLSLPEQAFLCRYATEPTPVAHAAARETLALPIDPRLGDDGIERICGALRELIALHPREARGRPDDGREAP